MFRFVKAAIIPVVFSTGFLSPLCADIFYPGIASTKAYTIMLYMNGDNDLTHEVLHAVDMLETVGSSADMNIIVLIDGRPGGDHGYGKGWDGSKLLYITHDTRIGEITSPVLRDMGEANLGDPATLESFIRQSRRFPADRYIFGTFAHGRGIIDTQILETAGAHKSLAISTDETNGSLMTLQQFRCAGQRGLNGKKFDAMVFFSCLTGMVEVGYALKDLTRYLIASEDGKRSITPENINQISSLERGHQGIETFCRNRSVDNIHGHFCFAAMIASH
jgi:hypothetical protein